MNDVGTKLRTLREQHKMTRTDLGKIVRINPNTLKNYESNVSAPPFDFLNSVCSLFNVDLNYFVEKTIPDDSDSFDYEAMLKNIGNKIKYLRKSNNLTQLEFGNILDIHASAISDWEHSKRFPEVPQLLKLAEYFKVPINFFFSEYIPSKSFLYSTEIYNDLKNLLIEFEFMNPEKDEISQDNYKLILSILNNQLDFLQNYKN